MIGYLYADGVRVAKVGRWNDFQNSWSQLWQVTLKGVEFDEEYKPQGLLNKVLPQELLNKVFMLFCITDGEEICFYGGQLEYAMGRFDGFDLRMNFRRKESKKKVNMEMIISEDSSLGEIKKFCEGREDCTGCPIQGKTGCKVAKRPDKWDLTFLSQFTDDELAWMRVMSAGLGEDSRMWLGRDSLGILYWKIEGNNGESRGGYLPQELFPLPRELFPQIQPGQRYELREVLK